MPKVINQVRKLHRDRAPAWYSEARNPYVPNAMSTSLWSIWNAAQLGLVKPTAAELSLLILLGAFLLALRTFRERYLKIWILGWTVLAASRLAEHVVVAPVSAEYLAFL